MYTVITNNMMVFNFEIQFQMAMSMTGYLALMRFSMYNILLNKYKVVSLYII